MFTPNNHCDHVLPPGGTAENLDGMAPDSAEAETPTPTSPGSVEKNPFIMQRGTSSGIDSLCQSDSSTVVAEETRRPTRYWGRWSKGFPTVAERIQQLKDDNEPIISVSSRQRKERIQGFPDLARHMGDRNCQTIFRSFASLRCRLLLYLQQEILELEHELDLIERAQENPNVHHDIDWLQGGNALGSLEDAQHEIVDLLHRKLKQQADMMLQQHQLYELPEPTTAEVQDVFDYITHIDNHPPSLITRDYRPGEQSSHQLWMKRHALGAWYVDPDKKKDNVIERDLVSLSGSYKVDKLTRVLTERVVGAVVRFLRCLYLSIAPKSWSSTSSSATNPLFNDYISPRFIRRLSNGINLVFASILPSVSIIVLFYIETPIWKLIFLMLWTIVFCVALSAFTTASREQVFSASVAMAAVQVVFIGSSMVQTVKVEVA